MESKLTRLPVIPKEIRNEAEGLRSEIKDHLSRELIPFWITRSPDEPWGGFLTYFDSSGVPTGETMKSLLSQARVIYSFSLAHQAGYGNGALLELAMDGFKFVRDHYRDNRNGGWFWTAERDGRPLDRKKIIYGHSFVIYAFSELTRASGDPEPLSWAEGTFETIQTNSADNRNGGYWEFFEENWEHCAPGAYGGDRKSLDVHMHLMETFTNLYDVSRNRVHARTTGEVLNLILERMTHPEYGTGIAQFSGDFTPLRAILFKNVWGADRDADDPEGRPLDNTSYGHNVELGWLLNHAADVVALDGSAFEPRVRALYDHCLEFGIDRAHGGVFCEGPHRGEARERNKEFWQQAETMVAMLDGFERYGDARYWDGYKNVHRFVLDKVINHEAGEWRALLDPDNKVVWGHLGTAWKINYHTIRACIQCDRRLRSIATGDCE